MRWLAFPAPLRFLPLLALVWLLVSACQPPAKTPVAAVPPPPPPVVDSDADYGCSYFYFLWGRHAELLLRFEEALEAYENALICDPRATYVSEKIPLLLLRLERTDEAAQWLDRYLKEHPDSTGMRMLYAKVLGRQGKNDRAMHQYQLISDRNPDDPAILLLLAEMYLGNKQSDQARAVLGRVLTLDPTSYPGHVLMARLDQQVGRTDEAADHYRQALARNWSSELQMELGELFIKTQRYDEAGALYRDIIAREDHNEGARIALVHVYLLQKKDSQALTELKNLRALVDQPQRVDLTIARLYAKQQHFDKAIAITEQILARENLPEARFFLAVLFAQEKKYNQALRQIRLVDREAPEFAEALSLEVRILREQDRADEAVRRIEENLAATDGARNAELYTMLAGLHQQQGRDELSRKALLRGLEAFPEDENLLYEYGLLLENSGDHAGALQAMQKIIELKPDHAAALNFVGYSWAEDKVHLDKALGYIQRAIELKPDNGYIRDSLGWVYFRLGRIGDAIKELEAAVRLSPDDPAILEHLGDVYLEAGRERQALETYRKALQLKPESEDERLRLAEKIRIIEKQGAR